MRLSVAQVSPMAPGSPLHPFGSSISIGSHQRIETVTDWPLISKKYRTLVGKDEPSVASDGDGSPHGSSSNINEHSTYSMSQHRLT